MKSYYLALAALAAIGFSGTAFAGEATHPGKARGPVALSDTEMDKVTAGSFDVLNRHGEIFASRVNFHAANNGFQGHNHNGACTNLHPACN